MYLKILRNVFIWFLFVVSHKIVEYFIAKTFGYGTNLFYILGLLSMFFHLIVGITILRNCKDN